jgi:hypothetical protein
MGWTTDLPWLIVAQILHCGTFTVCHLAAMRYIAAREGGDVIRLQAVYSVAMGGSIAMMTVFAGFLYQHLGHGVFWVMALALPAMLFDQKWPRARLRLQHGANMFLLLRVQCLNGMDQRRREQRQRRRVGVITSAASRGAPLLKGLQRQIANIERQQRQFAQLLLFNRSSLALSSPSAASPVFRADRSPASARRRKSPRPGSSLPRKNAARIPLPAQTAPLCGA